MRKLVSELPRIVSSSLDVPEDETKRLTIDDIQVWSLPSDRFDVNIKDLQLMILLHNYLERIVNLEERKNNITKQIGDILAEYDHTSLTKVNGWVWILPSSDTAFGKISIEPEPGKALPRLVEPSCVCDTHGNFGVIDWNAILKLDFQLEERSFLERLQNNKNFFTDPCAAGETGIHRWDMVSHINARFDCEGLKYRLRKLGNYGEYRIVICS